MAIENLPSYRDNEGSKGGGAQVVAEGVVDAGHEGFSATGKGTIEGNVY
jgi:hypothetical protein